MSKDISGATYESRGFANTGLTRDQAGILLEKGWSREDLRKIRQGGMFALGASFALKGERGRVNPLFATLAFGVVGVGLVAGGLINAEQALAHNLDGSLLSLSGSQDSASSLNSSIIENTVFDPAVGGAGLERGVGSLFNLDVEQHVLSNGLDFSFKTDLGEKAFHISDVDCGADSAVPQQLVFTDQATGGTISYDICSANLSTGGKEYPGNLLVENNGGVLGREWMMLSEPGGSDIRGSSLLVPLKGGTFDIKDPEAKKLQFLKTVDGWTVFHLNGVETGGVSYKTVFTTPDSVPASYQNLQDRILDPNNVAVLDSLIPDEVPVEPTSQPTPMPRLEVPVYNQELTTLSEGYTPQQKVLLATYVDMYPELDDVPAIKILELQNQGRETVSVIDFSTEGLKINPQALGLAFDYFAKLSMQGEYSESTGVTFEVVPNVTFNTAIGLIPNDVADRNFVLGPDGYAYTNWAWTPQEFNKSYIKLLTDPYQTVGPYDIPRTVLEDTEVSLITEICQSTNRVHALDFQKPQFTNGRAADMFGQELWCNSQTTAYFFKQKGIPYGDYVKFTESVGYRLPKLTGVDTSFRMLTLSETDYNGIPVTGPILSK